MQKGKENRKPPKKGGPLKKKVQKKKSHGGGKRSRGKEKELGLGGVFINQRIGASDTSQKKN